MTQQLASNVQPAHDTTEMESVNDKPREGSVSGTFGLRGNVKLVLKLVEPGRLKAPAIAIEQLAEALEERQLSDQRRKSEHIEFDDRRHMKRRASDLA